MGSPSQLREINPTLGCDLRIFCPADRVTVWFYPYIALICLPASPTSIQLPLPVIQDESGDRIVYSRVMLIYQLFFYVLGTCIQNKDRTYGTTVIIKYY